MNSPTWEEEFKRLPKELRHLTIEQSIGTKPLNLEEIEWRFNQLNPEEYGGTDRRTSSIAIFGGNGIHAQMTEYYKVDNYSDYPMLYEGKSILLIYNYGYIYYGIGESGLTEDPENLYSRLRGRLDSDIIRKQPGYIIDGRLLEANVILLDLKSIFIILMERFEKAIGLNSGMKAAKATKQILDNIVDDYQNDKLPALLVYLALNAEMLGLAKSEDYIIREQNKVKITKEYLDTTMTEKCGELYEMINNLFVNMKF